VEQDSIMANNDPTRTNVTASSDWNPETIKNSLGQVVKHIIFQGKSVRPAEAEDELFIVLSGKLVLVSDDKFIVLNPKEFVLISKEIEYQAIALEEVQVMCKVCPSTLP
jgi:mannose-6-phosphate isomerase-like protein (cupin superfamily)